MNEIINSSYQSDFDQPDGQKPGPSRASVRIMEGSDEELSEPSDTVQAGLLFHLIKSATELKITLNCRRIIFG